MMVYKIFIVGFQTLMIRYLKIADAVCFQHPRIHLSDLQPSRSEGEQTRSDFTRLQASSHVCQGQEEDAGMHSLI